MSDIILEYIIGDCRDHLAELPAIDLICTDPPFKFSATGRGMMNRKHYLKHVNAKMGSRFNPLDYLDLFYDVVHPFNAYFFTSKALIPVYLKWAIDKKLIWDILSWIKPNPTPLKSTHHLPDTEYIIFIKAPGAYWNSNHRFDYYRKWILEDSPNQHKKTSDHPTPKPLNVLKKLILVSCPPGGTVLDPFLGTARTLRACKELGMNGYGMEIDPIHQPEILRQLDEKQTDWKSWK